MRPGSFAMQEQERQVVRQVLNEAANAPHFFDQSDAERLTWLIARAFVLGNQQKLKQKQRKRVCRHERNEQQ